MQILITGVNGMLGRSILAHLKKFDFELFGVGRSAKPVQSGLNGYFQGDLTELDFVNDLRKRINPDWIIHCAALVNLRQCEEDRSKAESVHISATRYLAQAFPSSAFVYISTDSVFDGTKGGYTEEDTAKPLNVYALTKYLGEKEAIQNSEQPYVLRTNIYGSDSPSKGSIFEWAFRELSAGNEVSGYTNFVFNPLHVAQVAQVIRVIIEKRPPSGIYHLGSTPSLSKHAFLLKIAEEFGFRKELVLSAEADPNAGGIKRPLNTTLKGDLAETILGISLKLDDGFEILKKSVSNGASHE
jgi:dTDP-4-dehydrorhamnose reductase